MHAPAQIAASATASSGAALAYLPPAPHSEQARPHHALPSTGPAGPAGGQVSSKVAVAWRQSLVAKLCEQATVSALAEVVRYL